MAVCHVEAQEARVPTLIYPRSPLQRELQEERGLMADQKSHHWQGCLMYIYDTKAKAMEENVVDLDLWKGEPRETKEMKLAWYAHQATPLDDMWADDAYWLLQYVDGQMAKAPLAPAAIPRPGQGEAGAARFRKSGFRACGQMMQTGFGNAWMGKWLNHLLADSVSKAMRGLTAGKFWSTSSHFLHQLQCQKSTQVRLEQLFGFGNDLQ